MPGWRDLLQSSPCFEDGSYPIPAYSEFMPPPRLGRKAYGAPDTRIFPDDDPLGWCVSEYEEALELRPGLRHIAAQLVDVLSRLGRGQRAQGIEGKKLDGNPCWPQTLRERGAPAHERYLVLLPLALSRTQDDKGRIRWTLFGASDEGAERPFARSWDNSFFERLLYEVYGEKSLAGFHILEGDKLPKRARYVLTFTPFDHLPAAVQHAYLAGDLHLLPFPGSLLFFHAPGYQRLESQLPRAIQIPLLYSVDRNEAPAGIRVPQSGWMHEREDGATEHGPVRNTTKRTHRWTRVHRHDDELPSLTLQQKVTQTLFSAAAPDLGLYGKPMARNSQIWTDDYQLLLDGPSAGRRELMEAARAVDAGGVFGYRFFYPPMRVGAHEVYWHRPLVAWLSGQDVKVLENAPLGYLSAESLELSPRLLDRPAHRAIVQALEGHPKTLNNARKIVDACELLDEGPLDPSFARALLRIGGDESLDEWLERKKLQNTLRPFLGSRQQATGNRQLTFNHTATRQFEARYWKTIVRLAHGSYINKDNADCVLDEITQSRLVHHRRDLERLGDHILSYYERLLALEPVRGAGCGSIPFEWRTDFDFRWSGGWLNDQKGTSEERNLVLIIPGRDRSRAFIMADHYDTAYMEDAFRRFRSGRGPRLAAAGADDNHSATAALMLAAPIFLELSRAGRLEHDIWLVHLTGEEFPADCLGARSLCQSIVEGNLRLHRSRGKPLDLSKTTIAGAFVLDMVAHNNRRARDIFQICPGWGRESMVLARTAHRANLEWNAHATEGNERGVRRAARRGRRSADPRRVPPLARHLGLHGEVRPLSDAHSTLYNTDGQILSDTGIPVVLFMENYDIDRHGYHDSHDTMENIDLDYGAALVSIAIETVARAAGAIP